MASGKTTETRRARSVEPAVPAVDRSYHDLIAEFPLRPIRTEDESRRANEVIGRLADRGEDDLSPGETDYLDVLSTLMERWEEEHVPIDEPKTVPDRLRAFMEARGLSQSEVASGANVSRSTISEVLAGKRALGRQPATRLAAFFRVPVGLFLG